MVQYSPRQQQLDRAFAALADPTRRGILERLGTGTATISELAGAFSMTLTGIKKHVEILSEAGLVETEKIGRTRTCRLGARRLDDINGWLEHHGRQLEARLDRFGELLERRKGTTS